MRQSTKRNVAFCDKNRNYILKVDKGNKIYHAASNVCDNASLTKEMILTPAVRYRKCMSSCNVNYRNIF
jgi:hypothetical protein